MKEEKNVAQHYKRKQIESASPGKLIVMLYEKAIEHLDNAKNIYTENGMDKIEKFHTSLITAQKIITELTIALDMEKGGDLARNLYRLYDFMNYRLMDANVKKEMKAIDEVKKLLLTLKSGWEEVQDVPLPENAQDKQNRGLNLQG